MTRKKLREPLNQQKKRLLTNCIKLAGGGSHVSQQLGVTRKSVWGWTQKGLPYSEWSGATTYAAQIAQLCRDNGHRMSAKTILSNAR